MVLSVRADYAVSHGRTKSLRLMPRLMTHRITVTIVNAYLIYALLYLRVMIG